MGDRLTDDEASQTELKSYGDIFDELFPHYLYMGMTPEQYWDGESELKIAYRKAYRMRMKHEDMMLDRLAWYQGVYVRDALHSMPLLVAGFIPKGVRPGDYPKLPRLEQAEQEKRETDQKKRQENQMMLAMAMMQDVYTRFNRNMERKQSEPAKSGA